MDKRKIKSAMTKYLEKNKRKSYPLELVGGRLDYTEKMSPRFKICQQKLRSQKKKQTNKPKENRRKDRR